MANALSREKSPYLLQHAGNPVDWLPWGQEAFARARSEEKPVFLSIGYATCHWCHVMAHESFEDFEVSGLLNRDFIAVKVDREERPDVDSVYMKVCQALTGSGGWPLSVFLDADKRPFYAGTYFPKHTAMGRPGMIELLTHIGRLWKEERSKLSRTSQAITKALSSPSGSGKAPLDQKVLEKAFKTLAQSYDPRQGGFGAAPKFPTPHQLNFLLRWQQSSGNSHALMMVNHTLGAMRRGGIFDQVGLGFHRYSVDERWLVPHFEKMLYDQALLAYAYLEAFQVTGEEEHARAAQDIFAYVLRELTSEEGGFFSAEDADSEGEEGTYYLWTPKEIQEVLTPGEARAFLAFYNITGPGDFQGRNIPHITRSLEDFASLKGQDIGELAAFLGSARQKLLARREERERPLLDNKILTAWNGLMIAALAKGAAVLGEDRYLAAAERAADLVWDVLRGGDGRLLRSWRGGGASGPGYLEDYAFFIWGLIELHQAGQDPARLSRALDLAADCCRDFEDPVQGGFFFTSHGREELIIREKDLHDGATPAGNSVMAWNLLRLARLSGDGRWEKKAAKLMSALSARIAAHPMGHTCFLWALDMALGPGAEVVIVGDRQDARTRELLQVVHRGFYPRTVALLKPQGPGGDALVQLAPFTKDLEPFPDGPAAYVCRNYSCQRPVNSPDGLRELLQL